MKSQGDHRRLKRKRPWPAASAALGCGKRSATMLNPSIPPLLFDQLMYTHLSRTVGLANPNTYSNCTWPVQGLICTAYVGCPLGSLERRPPPPPAAQVCTPSSGQVPSEHPIAERCFLCVTTATSGRAAQLPAAPGGAVSHHQLPHALGVLQAGRASIAVRL